MPSEKELCIDLKENETLCNALRKLNHIFFNLAATGNIVAFNFVTEKFRKALQNYHKSSQKVTIQTVHAAYEALGEKFKDTRYATSDPKKVFSFLKNFPRQPKNSQPYIEPLLGKKCSDSKLFNLDLVIGLKLIFPEDDFSVAYRLDFDPDKNLHLNINFIFDGVDYPVTLMNIQPPQAPKERFFVAKPSEDAYCTPIPESQQSLLQQEMVKYKYSVKMALQYLIAEYSPKFDMKFFTSKAAEFGASSNSAIMEIVQNHATRKNFVDSLMKGYSQERHQNNSLKGIEVNLFSDVDSEALVTPRPNK